MSNFFSKYYQKYQSRWFWPCATAVFCSIFYLLHLTTASLISSITAFPFWQLGVTLRELSSKGGLKNAVSLVLFMALFLLPLSILGLLTLKRRHIAADWLLVLFSLLQAFILYGYVNPPLFTYIFPAMLIGSTGATDSLPQIVPAILGITLWSVLFAWMLLRFLYSLKVSGAAFPPLSEASGKSESAPATFSEARQKVFKGSSVPFRNASGKFSREPSSYFLSLLRILSILFTADIFSTLLGELPEAISALQDKNTGAAASTVSLTVFFLVLRFIAQALPSLFHLGIVLMMQKLLPFLETGNPFTTGDSLNTDTDIQTDDNFEAIINFEAGTSSETDATLDPADTFVSANQAGKTQETADLNIKKTSPSALPLLNRLFSFSRTGLIFIVLSQMVMNLLQLIMGSFLLDIDITLTFPFLSVCFLIAVLLFSRLLEDNIRLKADMELFI